MWPDVDEQGACEEGVSEADRGAQTAVALRRTRMEVRAASDWRRRDPASVMEAIAAGIVAVLRASDPGRFERVAEVLVEAGVTCVEFTRTSRGGGRGPAPVRGLHARGRHPRRRHCAR